MNSRNFIWYALPMMGFLALLWLYEPWMYQRYIASTDLEDIKKRDFKIIAHKGASGYAPENTLAAFELAVEEGADMIEIDVHLTADNEVIVFHDEELGRTTNGTGKVHEHTLAQIKELDAGSWFSDKYIGEKVPTLRETIDSIHGKLHCLIDIKSKGHEFYEGFAERIVDIIDEKGAKDWCIIQSYEQDYLEAAYSRDSTVQMKKLLLGEDESPLFSFYVNTKSFMTNRNKHHFYETLNPHYTSLSQRRIFRLHAKQYKVYTYVVNEREDMIKMLNMGVDGIITDFPDKLSQIRRELEAIDAKKGSKS